MAKKCLACGGGIPPRKWEHHSRPRLYCSHACAVIKPCPDCGGNMLRYSRHRTCSACRAKSFTAAMRCPCGAAIKSRAGDYRPRRYCSKACAARANGAKKRDTIIKPCPDCGGNMLRSSPHQTCVKCREPRRAPKRRQVPCKLCGQVFTRDLHRQWYCSDECRAVRSRQSSGQHADPGLNLCLWCGGLFHAYWPGKPFCSRRCQVSGEKTRSLTKHIHPRKDRDNEEVKKYLVAVRAVRAARRAAHRAFNGGRTGTETVGRSPQVGVRRG